MRIMRMMLPTADDARHHDGLHADAANLVS